MPGVIPALIMPPRIIFLLLRITPLRKIDVIAMRLVFPVVVVNHLGMIPRMVVTVISIVVTHLPLASAIPPATNIPKTPAGT
jgi:hypothetical protein